MCPPITSATRLGDLVARHPGATALLFGKGPSLDRFIESDEPIAMAWGNPIVLGFVNDTLAHRAEIISAVVRRAGGHMHGSECIPGLDRGIYSYAFANDSIERWRHLYSPGDMLFQPERTVLDPTMACPHPACRRLVFTDSGGDLDRLALPRAQLAARGLVAGHGTCDSAAQILALMGCTALVAIGFDGVGGRSARKWFTAIRADHVTDYAELRRDFEQILLRLDLPTSFFGEPGVLTAAGARLGLRVVRSVAIAGQHIEAGTIFKKPTPAEREAITAKSTPHLIPA